MTSANQTVVRLNSLATSKRAAWVSNARESSREMFHVKILNFGEKSVFMCIKDIMNVR